MVMGCYAFCLSLKSWLLVVSSIELIISLTICVLSTAHCRIIEVIRKSEFVRGPGGSDICHLSNLDETLPD